MGSSGSWETCDTVSERPSYVSGHDMFYYYAVGLRIYGEQRMTLEQAAADLSISPSEALSYQTGYLLFKDVIDKRTVSDLPTPYYAPEVKKEIVIPAWNDIIHLVPPYEPTGEELKNVELVGEAWDIYDGNVSRIAAYLNMDVGDVLDYKQKYSDMWADRYKKIDTAKNLLASPTPELFKNIGTIMTALDDVQDFTTTVGVLSRILGRVFKPAELLAIGAFTVGEFLNRLTMMSAITGIEKAVICHLVKDLKHSSRFSTIKEDVDKRMRRLFPSQGEVLEILQTTDQLFGVGISLGPLVGLVEDVIFGYPIGAETRFKEWKISDREKAVLLNIADRFIHPEKGFDMAFKDIARWGESAANIIITGDYHEWNDFATSLVTTITNNVQVRCTKVKEAAISVWEIITGQQASTPKKTKLETKFFLQRLGVDPSRVDAWPVPGLGQTATIQEIMNAYSSQAQKVLEYWRNKLGVSNEGLFLDACVKEIGLHAAAMFCDDAGVITESLHPSVLIFLHAVESGLNPPPDTSEKNFALWHDYVLSRIQYLDTNSPDSRILRDAYTKFFGV